MVAQQLLRPISTFEVKSVDLFDAKQVFVKNTKFLARSKIVNITDQFAERYGELIEKLVPPAVLASFALVQTSEHEKTYGSNILEELGNKSSVHLAHVAALIAMRGRGGKGVLDTTHKIPNLFKVDDVRGQSAFVIVGWRGWPGVDPYGWCLDVRDLNNQKFWWPEGSRVFAPAM
jgi:hypothetical protein